MGEKHRRPHRTDTGTFNRKPNICQSHSKQQCGKKQWNKLTSGPLRHPAENKDFWALQRTHQFPVNVIITQRARGFYRLIVVARRSPESTIDVGRDWERAVELFSGWSFDGHCLINQITPFWPSPVNYTSDTNQSSFFLDSFPCALESIKIY